MVSMRDQIIPLANYATATGITFTRAGIFTRALCTPRNPELLPSTIWTRSNTLSQPSSLKKFGKKRLRSKASPKLKFKLSAIHKERWKLLKQQQIEN